MSPRGRTVSRRRRNALIGAGGLIKTIAASEAIYSIGGQDDLIPPVTPAGNVGPQLLVDGDMEAVGVAAWTAVNNATLTKDVTSPHGGTQSLRVAYSDTANPAAAQGILTPGARYRVIGWARGDGTAVPVVTTPAAGIVWTGTNSTSWQPYDITGATAYTGLNFKCVTAIAGWCEFDDVTVYEQGL